MPEKLKRNTKIHRVHKNKKKLGRSIEERPKEVDERKEFGHWECDLVLGHKTKDDQVLLTLSERMSREFLIMRIPDKIAGSVMTAFQSLRKQYSEHWNEIFKTITTDEKAKQAAATQEAEAQKAETETTPSASQNKGKLSYQEQKARDSQKRKLERAVSDAEARIEKLEAEEQEIQTEMANPDIAASFEKLGPLQEKLSAVQEQLDQANNDWENALEALDEFE